MSTTPDVRVKLTAEGVAEVVNAFKRIQDEAEKARKAGDSGSGGLGKVGDTASKLKNILVGLGAVRVASTFVGMVKGSIELADTLGKLNQKTGVSVATLSTLSFGARTADVEQAALNGSMVKFARIMDEYDQGAKGVRDATKNLFGDAKALAGLNQDQRFLKIADALAKLEPGARRTGLAIQYFGKSGAELLPLIDDLGNGGFDRLREKAEKLGIVVDDNLAGAAQRANDAMKDLETTIQGMVMQFTTGLMPALADASEAFGDAITGGGGVDALKLLGEFVGGFITGLTGGFIRLGVHVAEVFSGIASVATRTFELLSNLARGRFKGSWDQFARDVKRDSDAIAAELTAKIQRATAKLEGRLYESRIAEKPKLDGSSSEDAAAAAARKKAADEAKREAEKEAKELERRQEQQRKASMQLTAAQQDYNARVAAAELKDQEAAEKERYDQGLTSLREYYSNRLALAERQGKAETDALYAKILELQNAPLGKDELPDERQAQVIKASADLQVKVLENEAAIKALRSEEAKETEDLQQKTMEYERRIREAQGDRFAAARAAIDAEAAQMDDLLFRQGVSAGERAARVSAFQTSGYQQVDFEELQQQAQAALDGLEKQRRQIDLQVQSGQLFIYEGEQRIMDLEGARLPQLQQIADAMRASAITPEQIQAAGDFQERIDQLAISSNRAALDMAQFKQSVEGAATSDLSDWLSNGIDQAENLGDAFRSLALSVVQSLRQIASQMLATLMIQKMLGFFAGAATGGGGASSTASVSTGPLTVASGGLVLGPGTGTSDSIAARLSNFEYVVRSAVVRQPGVLELLNTINYGTPRIRRHASLRFADGGLVDMPAAGGSKIDAGLTVGLDTGLVLKHMEADPEFHRLFVRMTQNNQKAMRSALGG